MNFKVSIIHRPERRDREPSLIALLRQFRDARILDAVVATKCATQIERAVYGCSASHLIAVADTPANVSALVLEDDAVADLTAFQQLGKLPEIPADCGAVLLGHGQKLPKPTGAWTPVDGPFYATQAVLYLPILRQRGFLEAAWRILAMNALTNPDLTLCYESILLSAVRACGLRLYRPPVLPFDTTESMSDRTDVVEPPRSTGKSSDTLNAGTPALPLPVAGGKESKATSDSGRQPGVTE